MKKILIGIGVLILVMLVVIMTNEDASKSFQQGVDRGQETVNGTTE